MGYYRIIKGVKWYYRLKEGENEKGRMVRGTIF
jgi:hypothetical protein